MIYFMNVSTKCIHPVRANLGVDDALINNHYYWHIILHQRMKRLV